MKILEVLDRVDTYLPHNQYSAEEKINWCNELGAKITQEIKKEYGFWELPPNSDESGVLLPKHIDFEMVESVRVPPLLHLENPLNWREFPRGRTIDKVDFRSYNIWDNGRLRLPPGSVVVYLMRYQPIRNIVWDGRAHMSTEGIDMVDPPFIVGDIIDMSIEQTPTVFNNINVIDLKIHGDNVDRYFLTLDWNNETTSFNVPFTITRLITEETEVPPPYDAMYINYVLAQMAFHQHDYERYNAQMAMFNSHYDAYTRWHKQRSPLNNTDEIRNYW